jgi:hypothetical protein
MSKGPVVLKPSRETFPEWTGIISFESLGEYFEGYKEFINEYKIEDK